MKTSDLTGALLDYWVARAMYTIPGHEFRVAIKEPFVKIRNLETGNDAAWAPSTDWAQGGPIIEREGIELQINWVTYAGIARSGRTREGGWHAELEHAARADGVQRSFALGEKPLLAAMRAYVASKFGDEVPDGGPTT